MELCIIVLHECLSFLRKRCHYKTKIRLRLNIVWSTVVLFLKKRKRKRLKTCVATSRESVTHVTFLHVWMDSCEWYFDRQVTGNAYFARRGRLKFNTHTHLTFSNSNRKHRISPSEVFAFSKHEIYCFSGDVCIDTYKFSLLTRQRIFLQISDRFQMSLI